MSASGFLVFRRKIATCVPNSVTNSSKLITDIKHKVLYFFIWGTGRLRTFSVKHHSFMLQMVLFQQHYSCDGRNERKNLLMSYFPYLLCNLRLCDRSTILQGDKTQDRHSHVLQSRFPKNVLVSSAVLSLRLKNSVVPKKGVHVCFSCRVKSQWLPKMT